MKPLESGGSVFEIVGALCRNIVSEEDVDDDSRSQLRRRLRKIVFSHLLKKTAHGISENKHFTEDVTLGLYMLIVQKMSSNFEWSNQEYNHVSTLIDKLDVLMQNTQYPWTDSICRLLIALASNQRKRASIFPFATKCSSQSLEGVFHIPDVFQPPQRIFLHHLLSYEVSPFDFFWSNFRESSLMWLELFKDRSDLGSNRACCLELDYDGVTSSGSFTDEGFWSPTIWQNRHPFDWSKISLEGKSPFLIWETIGEPYDIYCRLRMKICDKLHFCPSKLYRIGFSELLECVKALLVGVASHVFIKVGNDFVMIPGLYTEHTPPQLMFTYCKPLREAGHLFLRLNENIDDYPCSTSAAMSVMVNRYISNYINCVQCLQTTNLLQLTLHVKPLIDQLKFLVMILENKLSKWALLEKLYDHSLRTADMNIYYISSACLIDCSMVYFRLLDQWIFHGESHDDLFFKQNVGLDQVYDRYWWQRVFTFSSLDAPSFLPSLEIFECGKMNYLVEGRIIEEMSDKNRPQLEVVTDYEACLVLKEACKNYSLTGQGLYSTVLDLLKCEVNRGLTVCPADTANVDLRQCTEADVAKLQEKARLFSLMKQEMENFKKHQRLKDLECRLQELLMADQLAFIEFKKFVADYSFRFDVVEKFLKGEERCLKKHLLNIWRKKRISLNNERLKFLRESEAHIDEQDSNSFPSNITNWLTASQPIEEVTQPSQSKEFFCLSKAYESYNPKSSIHSSNKPQSALPSMTETSSSPGIPVSLPVLSTPDSTVTAQHGNSDTSSKEDSSVIFMCPTMTTPYQVPETQLNEFQANSNYEAHLESRELGAQRVGDGLSSLLSSVQPISDANEPFLSFECDESAGGKSPSSLFAQYQETDLQVSSADYSPSQLQLTHHGSVYNRLLNVYSSQVTDDILQPFKTLTTYYTDDRSRKVSRTNSTVLNREADQSVENIEKYSKSHLHFFLKKSVDYPLRAQSQVMSNFVLHTLFKEHDFFGHLKRMRDVFLMNNGFCAMTLATLLFGSMSSKAPQTFLVYPELQNIINLSFPSDSEHLVFKINHVPEVFDPLDPDLSSCLRLDYITKWPINLVLTNTAIEKYGVAFALHLSILRALWCLRKLYQCLFMRCVTTDGEHYRKIQVHRHTMLHVLNSLTFYFDLSVCEGWEQLVKELYTARNIDTIYAAHVKYLKGIHRKYMLPKQTARLQECLSMVLRCILLYCETVPQGEWRHSIESEFQHTKFRKLCHIFDNFMSLVKSFSNLLEYFIRHHGLVYLNNLLLPIKNIS